MSYYGRTCYKDCKDTEVEINCIAGSVLYEDKKCYTYGTTKKVPIAIVVSTKPNLAMAYYPTTKGAFQSDAKLPGKATGGYGTDTPVPDCFDKESCNTDGAVNTLKIIQTSDKFIAAHNCHSYYTKGTHAGDWFLPSIHQLEIAADQIRKRFSTTGTYWSSNEAKYIFYAWCLDRFEISSDCSRNQAHQILPMMYY